MLLQIVPIFWHFWNSNYSVCWSLCSTLRWRSRSKSYGNIIITRDPPFGPICLWMRPSKSKWDIPSTAGLNILFGCISVMVINLGWAATFFQNALMVKCFALKWHILRDHPISMRVFPHVGLEHRVCLPVTPTCPTYILFRSRFGWNHLMRPRYGRLTMLNSLVAPVLNDIFEPMTLHCWS